MRIGELAARTGVSVRALRYYEEQDLLTAERTTSGRRRYPDSAVGRVELIQELYQAGLSSRTIVELLPCVTGDRATPALVTRLTAERARIDRTITDLLRTRTRLDEVITGATGNMLTGVPCRDEPPRRHSARALIVTPDHRILLCRHLLPDPPGQVVWAAPGGGLEPGEMPLTALRRELAEEVGLTVETDPPYVWRQEFATTANDYFLIRTDKFRPHGALSDTELAAENITELRWWPLRDIATYRGPDLFSPRDLATPLSELLRKGAPPTPTVLGM